MYFLVHRKLFHKSIHIWLLIYNPKNVLFITQFKIQFPPLNLNFPFYRQSPSKQKMQNRIPTFLQTWQIFVCRSQVGYRHNWQLNLWSILSCYTRIHEKDRFSKKVLKFEWGNKVDWTNVEINIGANIDRADKRQKQCY